MELNETSTILKHATAKSLVILDELGRGTGTMDGGAIASAVARHMAHSIGCRTLFSTHYFTLTNELADDPLVKMAHMACMIGSSDQVWRHSVCSYRCNRSSHMKSSCAHVLVGAGTVKQAQGCAGVGLNPEGVFPRVRARLQAVTYKITILKVSFKASCTYTDRRSVNQET